MNIYDNYQDNDDHSTTIDITVEDVKNIQIQCEGLINLGKAASKLINNKEFMLVIIDDYFEKEPERLGRLLATGKLNDSNFDGAINDLKSIGNLKTYLSELIQKGEIAQDELKAANQALQESIDEQNKATS